MIVGVKIFFFLSDLQKNPASKAIRGRIIPPAWLTCSVAFIFRSLQAVTSVCQCAAAINKKTRFTSSASVPRPTRTIYCNLMLSRSKAYYTLCIILGSAAGQRSTSGWKYTSCGVGGIKCTRERIIFVTDQYQHQWVICAQLLAMFFFLLLFFLEKFCCLCEKSGSLLQLVTGIEE